MLQEGEEIAPNDVVPEIRRDVADAQRAVVLYLVRSSTTPQSWERLELDRAGSTFTGTVPVGESVEEVEQFFVQLVDDANNVSVSSKKGQDFSALPAPTTWPRSSR